MICKNCGAQIADGSQYCAQCGLETNFNFKCAKCGTVVSANAEFCQGCGARFKNSGVRGGKVNASKSARGFCIASVICNIMAFMQIKEKKVTDANDFKATVLTITGIALVLAIISCVEYYRNNQKCSIVTYVCIVFSAFILIAWLANGDEMAAEKVSEYLQSDEYRREMIRDYMRSMC